MNTGPKKDAGGTSPKPSLAMIVLELLERMQLTLDVIITEEQMREVEERLAARRSGESATPSATESTEGSTCESTGLTRQERWKKRQGESWREHRRSYMRGYMRRKREKGE